MRFFHFFYVFCLIAVITVSPVKAEPRSGSGQDDGQENDWLYFMLGDTVSVSDLSAEKKPAEPEKPNARPVDKERSLPVQFGALENILNARPPQTTSLPAQQTLPGQQRSSGGAQTVQPQSLADLVQSLSNNTGQASSPARQTLPSAMPTQAFPGSSPDPMQNFIWQSFWNYYPKIGKLFDSQITQTLMSAMAKDTQYEELVPILSTPFSFADPNFSPDVQYDTIQKMLEIGANWQEKHGYLGDVKYVGGTEVTPVDMIRLVQGVFETAPPEKIKEGIAAGNAIKNDVLVQGVSRGRFPSMLASVAPQIGPQNQTGGLPVVSGGVGSPEDNLAHIIAINKKQGKSARELGRSLGNALGGKATQQEQKGFLQLLAGNAAGEKPLPGIPQNTIPVQFPTGISSARNQAGAAVIQNQAGAPASVVQRPVFNKPFFQQPVTPPTIQKIAVPQTAGQQYGRQQAVPLSAVPSGQNEQRGIIPQFSGQRPLNRQTQQAAPTFPSTLALRPSTTGGGSQGYSYPQTVSPQARQQSAGIAIPSRQFVRGGAGGQSRQTTPVSSSAPRVSLPKKKEKVTMQQENVQTIQNVTPATHFKSGSETPAAYAKDTEKIKAYLSNRQDLWSDVRDENF